MKLLILCSVRVGRLSYRIQAQSKMAQTQQVFIFLSHTAVRGRYSRLGSAWGPVFTLHSCSNSGPGCVWHLQPVGPRLYPTCILLQRKNMITRHSKVCVCVMGKDTRGKYSLPLCPEKMYFDSRPCLCTLFLLFHNLGFFFPSHHLSTW